ncbi:MAG: hypothetical protein SFV51_12555, partial [Bryobacteraceae bacterium]|nr:hypothetical protein [Bryobacteraceae bacterium]
AASSPGAHQQYSRLRGNQLSWVLMTPEWDYFEVAAGAFLAGTAAVKHQSEFSIEALIRRDPGAMILPFIACHLVQDRADSFLPLQSIRKAKGDPAAFGGFDQGDFAPSPPRVRPIISDRIHPSEGPALERGWLCLLENSNPHARARRCQCRRDTSDAGAQDCQGPAR